MSIKYQLNDLDVFKLPKKVRELLAEPTPKDRTPHYNIWFTEKFDKPTYLEKTGDHRQFFALSFISLKEDGTPATAPAWKTDENGNDYRLTDDPISIGFCVTYVDPSELTYPLEEFFESIKL